MKGCGNVLCLLLSALFLLGGGCASPTPFQGKLDRLRRETRRKRKKRKREESRESRTSEDWREEDDEEGPFDFLELELLRYTLFLPFTIPILSVEDPGLQEEGYFLPWPYAEGGQGLMVLPGRPDEEKGKGWKVEVGLENGNDFHDLNRTGLTLLADGSARIGFLGRLDLYQEKGAHDLVMGVGDLTLRFAQCETSQFRVGLGGRFWADEKGGEEGVDFLYGMDFQPGKPLVLSLEFHAGTLGGATVTEERAVLGIQSGRFRFQGGYQHLKVGGVDLDGPFLGLNVSF